MAKGRVVDVHSKAQWDSYVNKADGSLVVVDFTATWCMPCQMIAPFFDELSDSELHPEYAPFTFLKVDVDELEALAQECNIAAMPTFLIFKDGQPADKPCIGASKDKLKGMVDKWAKEAGAA